MCKGVTEIIPLYGDWVWNIFFPHLPTHELRDILVEAFDRTARSFISHLLCNESLIQFNGDRSGRSISDLKVFLLVVIESVLLMQSISTSRDGEPQHPCRARRKPSGSYRG